LPDIPFDPKFITYPFDSNRFVSYKPTSLEKNYKHDLLTEHDLGVDIDLINPDTYAISADASLTIDPEDEKLLEDEPQVPLNKKRSKSHHKAVPWLKKTEYISTEFNRYGASSEKNETKVGYKIKKDMKEDNLYLDRESQIAAIDRTFDEAKKPIVEHHNKRGVTAVEIMPVFPDFELWKYPFAQVQFDSEPATANQVSEMSQAMIRGVMDESGEQFVAYFLPTEDTMTKRKRDEDNRTEYELEEEYEYKMAREYNWNVKSKANKGYEENYFFVLRENALVYNELETRVRLTKRRAKAGNPPNNSKLIVKHRPLSDAEFRTQEIRLKQLQPPADDDEAAEEEEEEEEEPLVAPIASETLNTTIRDTTIASDDELPPMNPSQTSIARKSDQANSSDESAAETVTRSAPKAKQSSSSSSSSSSGSDSSESSASSSSSSDEDDDEQQKAKKKRGAKNTREIFGSDSESD
jgi:RNA polymerase II-associated factor 1